MTVQDRRLYQSTPLSIGKFVSSREGLNGAVPLRVKSGSDTFNFGIFVGLDDDKLIVPLVAASTSSPGATLENFNARGVNSNGTPTHYQGDDIASIANAGVVRVRLDEDNKPANINTTFRISYASTALGFITTSTSTSRAVSRGLKLEAIGSNYVDVRILGEIVLS